MDTDLEILRLALVAETLALFFDQRSAQDTRLGPSTSAVLHESTRGVASSVLVDHITVFGDSADSTRVENLVKAIWALLVV